MDPLSSEELAARVDQALRALPLRRAPTSLEGRVQRAIASRPARPWWRAPYGHWPLPARMGFWMVSLALVGGLAWAGLSLGGGVWVESLWTSLVDWGAAWQVVAGTLSQMLDRWLPAVSSWWIYGGLLMLGMAYVLLWGIGAAAYRWLYRQP